MFTPSLSCVGPGAQAGAHAVTAVQRLSKKPGQKGKGAAAAEVDINIKEDWIAEHARQLESLLPGGDHPSDLVTCRYWPLLKGGPPLTSPLIHLQALPWWEFTSAAKKQASAQLMPTCAERLQAFVAPPKQVGGSFQYSPGSSFGDVLIEHIINHQASPNKTLRLRICAGDAVADLLIIYINRATQKLGLKELPADALQPLSLRVCEAKPGPVLAQFVSVSAK